MEEERTPADSQVITRYMVMPEHANTAGTMFGGVLLGWIDSIAAMVTMRHCRCQTVTASIDHLSFRRPINVGDHVVLKSSVNYVGNTSLEVGVSVWVDHPIQGKVYKATTAYLTFVCLDENKKPKRVPRLKVTTPDEIRRFENAKLRVESRKKLRSNLLHKEEEAE